MFKKSNTHNTRRLLSLTLAFVFLFVSILQIMPGMQKAFAIPVSQWFQNFESAGVSGNYGLAAFGTSSNAVISSLNAANASTQSVKLTCTNDNNSSGQAWNADVYGLTINPQDDVKVDGQEYFDASGYSYFSFYVYDGDAHNVNVVFTDAGGKTWSPSTETSVKDTWTKLTVALDTVADFDFSRITSIKLGEYWGYGNIYYFDELYFSQNADDAAPAYPPAPKYFQSFDSPGSGGDYGIAGAGSSSAAAATGSRTAHAGSKKSARLQCLRDDSISNQAWNDDVYGLTASPQDDAKVAGQSYFDASGYGYFSFYVYDADVHNVNVVFTDAGGKTWSPSTSASVKDTWTKLTIALDKTADFDFSKISTIKLGEYWGGGNLYFFDDLYFSPNAEDIAPSFIPAAASKTFQNFESAGSDGSYGIAGKGTQTDAAVAADCTAFQGSANSILTNQHGNDGAWDLSILGVAINPQDDSKVSGQSYMDASMYNYLTFYVKDINSDGGCNLHVLFKDADGGTWDTSNDWNADYPNKQNTKRDSWVKISVPIDRTKIDFSKLSQIQIGSWFGWDHKYYFDDFAFSQDDSDCVPAALPKSYQNFEAAGGDGNNGIAGGGTQTDASLTTESQTFAEAFPDSKNGMESIQHGDGGAWDLTVLGAAVNPQDDSKVSGQPYMDASKYNYMILYVKDINQDGGCNLHISFKDANGFVWDTSNDWSSSYPQKKTVKGEWVKLAVPLDKTRIDFSKLTQIQIGSWYGWDHTYYFDDFFFAQNDTDNSPYYVAPENKPSSEPTVLFNDFENGDGYSGGSGVSAAIDSDCVNVNETRSVKITVTNSGMPDSTANYIDISPKNGSLLNTTGHEYLVFYVKDTQGSNTAWLTLFDATGGSWSGWTEDGASKDKWSRITVPLTDVTGVDKSKISKVRIGEYNAGTYYFDDVFFAQYEDDVLPGFESQTQNIGSVWYQNFEVKGSDSQFGFDKGTGATASVETGFTANPFNSRSVKLVLAENSADPAVNGITIKPQALAPSLDKADKYDYQSYFNASNFSHLVFYAYDAQGSNDLNITVHDTDGKAWSFKTSDFDSQTTSENAWTRFVIPLDKATNPIDYSKVKDFVITAANPGTYYFDEFYFAKNAGDGFPNAGYTQLNLSSANGEIIPYENGIPLSTYEKQRGREYISLDGTWKKERVTLDSSLSAAPRDNARKTAIEAEAGNRYKSSFDDSAWTGKTLPMPEDTQTTYESKTGPENKSDNSGYQGGVWYRKHFTVGSDIEGKDITLNFLGVNYFADVWINGTYVGGHQGGYTPFSFDAGSLLNYGSDNVIAVRVDNTKWDTFQNGEIIPYKTSDWFNYTGILRSCYLEATDSTHIVRSDIKTLDTNGNIEIKTVIDNKSASGKNVDLSYAIYEANITEANITSEFAEDLAGTATQATASRTVTVNGTSAGADKFTLNVPQPKLWSPSNPNLYILKIEEKIDGSTVDTFYTQFGIRTLAADGVKIMLNGELAPFLTGVGYTEDSPDKGPSMSLADRYRDLSIIRNDMKANFIRTGHFPNSINTYQLTDRLGLAVWQEIPAYWFSGDAFDLQRQRGQAKQMFTEMIYSNYNRPSVWFDGTCNESGEQLQRVNYITELRELAHEIDGSRLVGQSAVANPYKGESDASHSAADVIGMTMYFGVFYGSNADVETQAEIEAISAMHPNKPIIATEYGYWSGDEGPTDTKQTQVFTGTFNAFARIANVNEDGSPNPNGLLSGCTWWTAFNWYTNITGLQTMGLYHMDRTGKKQVADILAERYNRYNHITEGSEPDPAGISDWFQSFESGKGSVASDGSLTLSSDTDSPAGNGQKDLKVIAGAEVTPSSYVAVVPQGSSITKDVSTYNYLNFYVKDSVGNNDVKVTLVDADGVSWTANASGKTVKDTWTKLSVPLADMQGTRLAERKLNSLAISEVRIGITAPGTVSIDDLYMSTYTSDAQPQSYPVGKSGWFQSFEAAGTTVAAGTNASAALYAYGVNPGGLKSVKLDVSSTGYPGADGHCVKITPQGSAASLDASDFNYLCFYVKDTQGSNTVDLTFIDADGGVSTDIWSSTSSIKGQWTKMYVPLDKVGADLRQIKEIRLAEWNEGTYYFDDLYFAESPTDEIPNTYTEEIPVKPVPENLIKVACIGDSITAGAGLSNPGVTSYPAQLQSLLGTDKYLVKNFGVSGRTLLKAGDSPYWNETAFTSSKNFNPDIVVIQLGTNDTKPWNWNGGTNQFLQDYKDLINTYKALPSHPKVYVNLPPWVYNDDPAQAYAILSSVLQNGVIPLIRQAAAEAGGILIDVNSQTKNMPENFPDKVHPNAKGAWIIADTVAKFIDAQDASVGDTSVTKWKDNKASAYSITYDDGIYNSVLKFEGLNEKYGLKATLALINDWIDRQYNDMGSSTGTWAQWKAILDRGSFDVASHTFTHKDLTKMSQTEIDEEFADSISEIYENTGHKPETMATPYGATNDLVNAEAEKYFIVSRGLGGSGNASDTTNYQNLSSTLADSTTTVSQLNTWLDNGIAKGKWLVFAAHGCDGEGWSSPNFSLFDNHYSYLSSRMDSVWNDTMANVGKYLRERENATVNVTLAQAAQIKLELTDTLADSLYDFPLTLKTRVPDGWTAAVVTQGSTVKTITPVVEGAVKFIYYDAVPDKGEITIKQYSAPSGDGSSSSGNGGNTGTQNSVPQVTAPVPVVDPDTGIATTSISSEEIEKAFKIFKKDSTGTKTIEVQVPKVEGQTAYQVNMPSGVLSSGSHNQSVVISTDLGSIEVPSNMLSKSDVKNAKSIGLTVAAADKTQLDAASLAAIGDRPVLELGVKVDGKTIAWSNPDAPVTVSIPYTPSQEELADPDHIVVWYIDGAGKVVSVPTGRYDPATGTVTFATTHFSKYAVAFVKKAFTDTAKYPWAEKAIGVIASKGILSGTSATTFSPAAKITRADFMYVLVRSLGLSATADSNFADISPSIYYYEAVGIAKSLGITNGTGNNKFNPNAEITRQEMMTFVVRAMKLAGKNLEAGTASDLSKYTDKNKIASYAIDSMATLVRSGIITGSGSTISPAANATRAEVAVVMYKIYNR